MTIIRSHHVDIIDCDIRRAAQARRAYLDGHENDWAASIAITTEPRNNIKNASSYISVLGCLIADGGGESLTCKWAVNNVRIENCEFRNNAVMGPYIVYSQNITICNNVVYWTDDYVNDLRGSMAGIVVSDEHQYHNLNLPPSRDCKIYNNLIVGNGDIRRSRGAAIELRADSNLINFYVGHNTISNCRTSGMMLAKKRSGYAWKNTVIENNIVAENANSVTANHSGVLFRNNQWPSRRNAGSGAGNGDVYGDPKFADPPTTLTGQLDPADFFLSKPSPAVDKGFNSQVISNDFEGRPRGNKPDIGFAEYNPIQGHKP